MRVSLGWCILPGSIGSKDGLQWDCLSWLGSSTVRVARVVAGRREKEEERKKEEKKMREKERSERGKEILEGKCFEFLGFETRIYSVFDFLKKVSFLIVSR